MGQSAVYNFNKLSTVFLLQAVLVFSKIVVPAGEISVILKVFLLMNSDHELVVTVSLTAV